MHGALWSPGLICYAGTMQLFISVVIPAYNEAQRLPKTLNSIEEYVAAHRTKFGMEVLVVDDGSSDQTVQLVEAKQLTFPELKVITNRINKGKGEVVKQGMLAAAGTWRLFTDADSSTPITELEKLLPFTSLHPETGKPLFSVIIGSRHMNKGSIKVRQPLQRRILSRFGNKLIQSLTLPGIVDTQCGFKLFHGAAADKIFDKQSVAGWLFDVEILTIARALGYKVKEVPVDWYDADKSKLRALRAGWRSLRDLRKIRANLKRGDYNA